MVSNQGFSAVQQSYGRVMSRRGVFARFYEILLASSPEVAERFKSTDFQQQYELLEHSLTMVMLYSQDNVIAKQAIGRIRESHSRNYLNIDPGWYQLWIDSLIKAVSEFDPEFDDALEKQWRSYLAVAIDHIKAGY